MVPDHRHRLTRTDLLENGRDLYLRAVELLKDEPVYFFYGWEDPERPETLMLCRSRNLELDYFFDDIGRKATESLDQSLKGTPVEVDGIAAEVISFTPPAGAEVPPQTRMHIKGYVRDEGSDERRLVASRQNRRGDMDRYPALGAWLASADDSSD